VGERWEERARDLSEELARNATAVFKEQNLRCDGFLKQIFQYHFSTPRPPSEVRPNIVAS